MNEVDRQILSFMRDVKIPEQGDFYLSLINDNIEADIRESHLELLEYRGLIQSSNQEVSTVSEKSYRLTAEGLQAITTEDLNQTLGTTNERLSETQDELNEMQESQSKSAAVQTIFSFTIISFTSYQIFRDQALLTESGIGLFDWGILAVGVVLALTALLFGKDALIQSFRSLVR